MEYYRCENPDCGYIAQEEPDICPQCGGTFFAPLLEHWDEQDCAALDESCRKRLETARAFAAMPDVVIFAHAASQLDTKETEALHTLIRDSARRRDRVYIVIESDTHELTQLGADELCRLS